MNARTLAALSGALMMGTLAACGEPSSAPSNNAPATGEDDTEFTDNPNLKPLDEVWRTKPGSGVVRVHVIVLPGDASVTVDGVLQRRRDGVIELIGKDGDHPRLRVVKGAQYLDQEVTIHASGASPSSLNLNEMKPLRLAVPGLISSAKANPAASASADAKPPENSMVGDVNTFGDNQRASQPPKPPATSPPKPPAPGPPALPHPSGPPLLSPMLPPPPPSGPPPRPPLPPRPKQ